MGSAVEQSDVFGLDGKNVVATEEKRHSAENSLRVVEVGAAPEPFVVFLADGAE